MIVLEMEQDVYMVIGLRGEYEKCLENIDYLDSALEELGNIE